MGQGVELAQPFRGGDIRGLSLDREQPGTRRLDQKVVLVGEAGHPQSGTFGRFRDPGEIDVRGDVLPSGRDEGILPRAVGVVAAQGAPAAGGGVVLVPFVSVVDDPPDSLLREKGRAFRHPVIDRRSDLGVVVIGKIVAEALREITERRRERPEHPGEAIAVFVLSDTAFVPNPFPVEKTMKGERVEELVAQKDPAGRSRRRDVADDLDAGLVNHYYLLQRIAELGDVPAQNHFFGDDDPGGLVMAAGAGILQSSDQPEAAEQFIRHLLSKESQEHFLTLFEYPLLEGVGTPEGQLPLDELPTLDISLTDTADTLDPALTLIAESGLS